MKITDLELEHYGIYRHASWRPAKDRLVVVMGENESGKTTLLNFIRDMLFGYRRGEWKDREGNMAFTRSDGSKWRVFRHGKDSWFVDEKGETIREDLPSLWWHGLSRALYARIFAVGLEDLQGAGFLAEDDVRGRFFMLQGGDRLADAKKALSGEMEELLVPSSQGKREINELLKRLDENKAELEKLSVQEKDFSTLQQKQKDIKKEMGEVSLRLRKAAEDDKKLEKQLGAWEYYKRAREIRRRLDLSEQVKMFPSNGKEQWNNLVSRMKVIHDQKGQLQEKLGEYTPRKKEEVIPWAASSEDLEKLYVDLGQWKQTLADEEELVAEHEAWEKDYVAMGPFLSLWGRPLSLDEECLPVNWEEGRKLAQEVNVRANELHFWENKEPKVEAFDETVDAISDIKSEDEWKAFEAGANRLEALTHSAAAMEREITALSSEEETHYTLWFWLGVVLTVAAAAGVGAFYLSYAGYEALYGTAGAAAAALLSFALNSHKAHKKEKKLAALKTELERAKEEKKKVAAETGLALPEKEEDISLLKKTVGEKQAAFFQYQAKAQALSWKRETVNRQEEEHKEWEARGKKLQEDKKATDKAWSSWLTKNHLPQTAADNLSELQEQWQKIYSAQGKGKILAVLLEKAEGKLRDFTTRAASIIRTTGVSMEVSPDSIAAIYEENRKRQLAWQAIAEKNKQHEAYQKEMDKLEDQWLACQKEMHTLFALVNAKNAEEFAERVTAHEQHDQLKKEWDNVRQDMRMYAGSEAEFQELWKSLETGEYEAWMKAHETYEETIKTDTNRLGELQKLQGSTETELLRLANDGAITKALQEKEEIQTELTAAVSRWLTAMYASHFIEEAQKQYESGKRPKIIEKANAFLSAMTGGRYLLSVPEDGKNVYITDSDHNRKGAKIWSSGTGDQVYLALRLSMALAFGKQIEPLPIVLDDIFVRFDERRQRETLRFLFDLGKEQQIFLFTCHEQTMRIAMEEGKAKETGSFIRLASGHIKEEA